MGVNFFLSSTATLIVSTVLEVNNFSVEFIVEPRALLHL